MITYKKHINRLKKGYRDMKYILEEILILGIIPGLALCAELALLYFKL